MGACQNEKAVNDMQTGLRCLDCFARFVPRAGSQTAVCPSCGLWWRITWVDDKFAKIRGPVWKKFPGLDDLDI